MAVYPRRRLSHIRSSAGWPVSTKSIIRTSVLLACSRCRRPAYCCKVPFHDIGIVNTKSNKTSVCAPPSIRFPSPKPRQNTSPRQLTSQKLVASTPKTGARQTRHTSQPKVRKKQLLTRRYADRTRTPIQAALTYPIEGHCPPAQKPLQPPTTVARVPAPASEKHPDVRPFAGS